MSTAQKLWNLLTSAQRKAAILLAVFMLIGMVLETLGVGLVIPALALMTDGGASKLGQFPELSRFLAELPQSSLVVGGILVLGAVYAIKALFLTYLAWRQSAFVFCIQADFSQRLFNGYLSQAYTFHLERNSAQLISNATTQIGAITGVVQQGLIVVTESMVALGLSLLMLSVEPLGAILVVSTLGLAGWIFYRKTKARIASWGKAHYWHEGLRIQHLQQGLGGVKEVKLLGREQEFLSQYERHNNGAAQFGRKQFTLQALPRIWMELLAVWGLVCLVVAMVLGGKPFGELLPTLALFSAAAFRIMPSVNRLINSIQSVRFALPAVDMLHKEFGLFKASMPEQGFVRSALKEELTLDGVTFQYPSAQTPALRDISLRILPGSSVGFIGGSGAGKSTLVDVILGLLTPSSGVVRIDGTDIQANLRGWQSQIGYVPQSIFLTDDTLRRNVAFGLPDALIDEEAVWRAIRSAQLESFIVSLPEGLNTSVGERGVRLSGGQRQRIGIARALYHDPDVLVLDEATSALDTKTEQGIMDAVNQLKGEKTVLIVAHRLSTIYGCDVVFNLDHGRLILEGAPSRTNA